MLNLCAYIGHLNRSHNCEDDAGGLLKFMFVLDVASLDMFPTARQADCKICQPNLRVFDVTSLRNLSVHVKDCPGH